MVKVKRSTLIAAAVVLFFFLALTAVAYVNSLRQARATQIFNAAAKYLLVPHGIAVCLATDSQPPYGITSQYPLNTRLVVWFEGL